MTPEGRSRDSRIPANGNGHQRLATRQIDCHPQEERKRGLRLAAFCLAAAAVLILADVLARVAQPPDSASNRNPLAEVVLEAHPSPNRRTHNGLVVRLHLCNRGKQAIFCSVHPDTNLPVGQVLVRKESSSEWIKPSDASDAAASTQMETTFHWIEMPPSGCIDTEFEDQVELPGEHAYEVLLRANHNSVPTHVVSAPYHWTSWQ
jgi:hypothetical protein